MIDFPLIAASILGSIGGTVVASLLVGVLSSWIRKRHRGAASPLPARRTDAPA